MTQQRKSIALSPEEWENLQDLAKKHNICAPTGVNVGKPSWRSFIKAIAKGDVEVISMDQVIEEETVYDFVSKMIPNKLV